MKMRLCIVVFTSALFAACGGSDSDKNEPPSTGNENATAPADTQSAAGSSETSKGIGKFQHVELTHPLDDKMVASGKSVYDVKCASCHKLSEEKLVGPGWKGVTDRRAPEWIMNFVTNTEEMLNKDAAAKNLYEICLVKMPNQNLSDDDARHVLEYMRNNDGKK